MAEPGPRTASYEDLLAVPDNLVGELVFGVLYTSPRPAPRHARAASRLGSDLGGPFDRGRGGPGGWVILFEPEVHMAQHVVVPDLAGWRRERMPELPVEKPYLELAQDWVCEVLSPRTAALDRGDKRRIYAESSVRHLWFIDPEAKTLEVLGLDGGSYRVLEVFSGEQSVRAVPFDAIELELGALWAR